MEILRRQVRDAALLMAAGAALVVLGLLVS